MITRWLKMVTEVLVLTLPKDWPRAWHWFGVQPVVISHANS